MLHLLHWHSVFICVFQKKAVPLPRNCIRITRNNLLICCSVCWSSRMANIPSPLRGTSFRFQVSGSGFKFCKFVKCHDVFHFLRITLCGVLAVDDSVCLAMAWAQRCPTDVAVLCRSMHRAVRLPRTLFNRDTQYLCRVSVDDVFIGCISAILFVYRAANGLPKTSYRP